MENVSPSNTPKPQRERVIVYDFSALDANGEPVWYFLSIPESREKAFLSAINAPSGTTDIKQFGTILASGKGDEAPESVRQEIMQKHAAG